MGISQLRRIRLDAKGAPLSRSGEALLVGAQGTGLDIATSGRMVYARRFRDTSLWRLDLTRPEAGFDDARLPASTMDEHTPDYSPDGANLAFTSTRTESEEIWISEVDGARARQMTSMGGPLCSNPKWSPDGRAVVFDSTQHGVRHLYRLDVATAEVRQLTSGPLRHHQARWSRDGRWIYFGAYADEGPRSPVEIRRMPADGGPSVRITTGAVAEPSHDERWLFVARTDEGQITLWRLRLPGGRPELFARDIVHETSFAVGRRAIFVVQHGASPISTIISEIDIATGQRREVAVLGKRRWWGLALSPDERYLIVPTINEAGSDLMVVEPVR
jgi:tricorn protease-like protein